MKHSKSPKRLLRRQVIACTGAAWLLAKVTRADDWITHRSRRRTAVCRSGVPTADYKARRRSVSFVSASLPAVERAARADINERVAVAKAVGDSDAILIPSRVSPPAVLKPAAPSEKTFLLHGASVGRAPFSISRFALTIDGRGRWQVSLQATYTATDAENRPLSSTVNKRHSFSVLVRTLSGRPGPQTSRNSGAVQVTRPSGATAHLFQLDLGEFWVQRDVPRSIAFQGTSPVVAQQFAASEFAELQFFVYLDEYGSGQRKVLQGDVLR